MTEVFGRYLRLLGIAGLPSGLDGLRTLVRRHLAAVPFENISKLLLCEREGAGRALSLPEFLGRIEFLTSAGPVTPAIRFRQTCCANSAMRLTCSAPI